MEPCCASGAPDGTWLYSDFNAFQSQENQQCHGAPSCANSTSRRKYRYHRSVQQGLW